MKIKYFFFGLFLWYYLDSPSAQETRPRFIGVEAGINFIEGEISNMNYIRGDVPSYSYGNTISNLTSLMDKEFVGIKYEILFFNKLGVSSGIRISRINSSIGKDNYWANSVNYFYLLYRQDGINTDYLKVNEINQITDYVGIPIEARYFAFSPRLFRLFFKLGVDINYRFQSKTNVIFNDAAMDVYKSDVAAMVRKPQLISSTIYGSAGFKIGKESKPSISIEVCLPALFMTSETQGMLRPNSGGGIQFNFQIPIKTHEQ